MDSACASYRAAQLGTPPRFTALRTIRTLAHTILTSRDASRQHKALILRLRTASRLSPDAGYFS